MAAPQIHAVPQSLAGQRRSSACTGQRGRAAIRAVTLLAASVNVTFEIQGVEASQARIVGSSKCLGSWSPQGGVPLLAAGNGHWTANVADLDNNCDMEFKLVLLDEGGSVLQWEPCNNRRLQVDGGAPLLVRGAWGHEGLTITQQPAAPPPSSPPLVETLASSSIALLPTDPISGSEAVAVLVTTAATDSTLPVVPTDPVSPHGAPIGLLPCKVLLAASLPDDTPGGHFVLVGSSPELGAWDAAHGLVLNLQQDGSSGLWTTDVDFLAGVAMEAKVVLVPLSGPLQWEDGSNRSLLLQPQPPVAVAGPASGRTHVILHQGVPDVTHYMWSPAGGQEDDLVAPPSDLPTTLRLCVVGGGPQTANQGRLVLVGSLPELGAWDPEQGLLLSPQSEGGPSWEAQLQLPLGTTVEAKLVLLHEDGRAEWESGSNHQLAVSAPTGVKLPSAAVGARGVMVLQWGRSGDTTPLLLLPVLPAPVAVLSVPLLSAVSASHPPLIAAGPGKVDAVVTEAVHDLKKEEEQIPPPPPAAKAAAKKVRKARGTAAIAQDLRWLHGAVSHLTQSLLNLGGKQPFTAGLGGDGVGAPLAGGAGDTSDVPHTSSPSPELGPTPGTSSPHTSGLSSPPVPEPAASSSANTVVAADPSEPSPGSTQLPQQL